ncbi:MAG: cytochrome c3 family protein [Slackia sp.]|nr:cytochrome c3 family protein [Slackia sp.]
MKKSNRLKSLLVVVAGIAALSLALAGCASGASTGSSAASSDLEKQFPAHTASVEAGEGEAGFHAQLGQDCESCHVGDLNAEVATLAGADSGEEPALSSAYYMDSQVCLDCHGGTWEELAKLTEDLGDYNPHNSLHGTIENCNECHKGHAAQVDLCSECHDNGGQTMKGLVNGPVN